MYKNILETLKKYQEVFPGDPDLPKFFELVVDKKGQHRLRFCPSSLGRAKGGER
jgi:hypothetical protein